MRGMFFRGVVLGSVTSVLVVSASVALAGSGVGGIFNLGKSNSVNKTSSLTGSTPGATQLVVSNSATNTGSRGLLVTGHSPTGALLAQNSLGKAASFQSGSSYPPFDVNSTKKVTNLNADQLDGIDSSGLIQGKGKVYTLAVAIPRPTSGNEFNGYTPSPAVAPGFVNLSFGCPPVGSGGSGIGVSNLNGGEMNVFLRNTASPTAYYVSLAASGLAVFSTADGGDITTITIQGQPPSTGLQTITVATVSSVVRASDCHFQIQALTTNS